MTETAIDGGSGRQEVKPATVQQYPNDLHCPAVFGGYPEADVGHGPGADDDDTIQPGAQAARVRSYCDCRCGSLRGRCRRARPVVYEDIAISICVAEHERRRVRLEGDEAAVAAD